MRKRTVLKLESGNADVVSCFDAAVHNAVKINTVRCRYRRYNKTGLLRYPYMVRAGRNYKTPWTRDASVNTWQAMNFIEPEVSRTTLLAVCDKDESGEPVIQPDVQTWDRIIWVIGAYNYCLVMGDEELKRLAHGIAKRALEKDRRSRFNKKYGLFVGGSFFNDGIAGYPLSCHCDGLKDSFAPSHPVVETIMCLSTNCLYCEAYRIYGELSESYGYEKEATEAIKYSKELKKAINDNFWSDELKRYRYILFSNGSTDDSQEASGNAFAVLFDICPKENQRLIIENLVIYENGAVSIHPPFEGLFSKEKPGRHNNVIWPFINGFLIEAAAKCGLSDLAGDELERITALVKKSKLEFYEIYSPYTQKAFGGWQTGRVWDSCRDQTWSATCYIGAIILGLFGVKAEEEGVSFYPCIPEKLKNSELKGIKLHGQELSVKINGHGSRVKSFLLDGKESEPFIEWDGKSHKVEITLE